VSQTDFSRNLKLLCSFEKSVSEVCRAIDINRQQFNKYLNSASQPSPFNLQRICDYFQIPLADLYLSHDGFSKRIQFRGNSRRGANTISPQLMLRRAFPGDLKGLRRYLGYYHTHFHSFSWPGYILVSLVYVYELDGMVLTKTIERVRDPVDGNLYLSKYDGYISLLGNRIFVIEFQSLAEDAIVETVLHPVGRSQLTLLRAVTFGLSSKHRNPYVSKTVWKHLGRTVDVRRALGAIGLQRINSTQLDPKVINILGDEPFSNEQLHYALEKPMI
jgi:transcriptional regulator with XRE-family HTH domain